MAHPNTVVFRFHRINRYSFLALLASLEPYEDVNDTRILWLEARAKEEAAERLERLAKDGGDLLVVYSFMTPQWAWIREEIKSLRESPHRDRFTLIAGGPHPAGAPKTTLQAGFDAVCVGEGETVFPSLLRAWVGKRGLSKVAGLFLPKGHKGTFTGPAPRADLDAVPALPLSRGKYGPIEITRGCPYGCKYCQTPRLKGRKVRHRRSERVFEAVESMVAAHRTDIRFISPNALAYGSPDGKTLNLEAVKNLLAGIRERLPDHGRIFFGTFPSEVRPEFITPSSLKIIAEYCHNRSLVMGAQSGDPAMLARMNRGHSRSEVRKACRLMRDFGFQPVVDFILGLPGETEDAMNRTVDLMEELVEMGARIHAHTFIPLPGSPWSAMSPVRIPDKVRSRIELLISHGKLFGQWKRQEEIARRARTTFA